MGPVNQVFLGGSDPILGNMPNDLDIQIQTLEAYKQKLQQMKTPQTKQQSTRLIWDDIDAEVAPMTDEQRQQLLSDEDYLSNYNALQAIVQGEVINLVKGRIESTKEGKELLDNQLKLVKKLKVKIINDSNNEMLLFKKFREYIKTHPEATYDEFVKNVVL